MLVLVSSGSGVVSFYHRWCRCRPIVTVCAGARRNHLPMIGLWNGSSANFGPLGRVGVAAPGNILCGGSSSDSECVGLFDEPRAVDSTWRLIAR